MDSQYPIRAVARMTGLSIDILRAWERRYSAVVPERSERGRLYSRENVQRLILLRDLVESGHSIGQIAARSDGELRQLLASEGSAAVPDLEGTNALTGPLLEAFTRFEHTRANETLGRLAALLSPRDLVFRVVLPLMHEVGERWHCGEIGIAEEHLVSGAMRNLFGSVVRLHPPRPGSPKVLISTLSGELHEFGILAAAMIAAIAGLDPVYLGPSLPAEALAGAAATISAEIVLVGCRVANIADVPELFRLAELLPQETELWIGGLEAASEVSIGAVVLPDMAEFERHCYRRTGPPQ